jgi:hypothetical protein
MFVDDGTGLLGRVVVASGGRSNALFAANCSGAGAKLA